MKYAINIPPFTDAREIVRLGVDAEAAGWDGVFVWDHLRWSSEERLDLHDPWVLLGALALGTHRVMLGTLVTPVSRRRPWKLAKEVITLDHLSNGRAVLGVGLGAPADADFAAFGDVADGVTRASMLDEALEIIDPLLRGRPVDHRGTHYTVRTHLSPAAVQMPRPPVWVAGVAPNVKPLERARRWDGFVPIGKRALTPDALAAYVGSAISSGWDVVAGWVPGVPPAEYADAGATWLVASTRPTSPRWFEEFGARVRRGPQR